MTTNIDSLLDMYEHGTLTRRELLQGLAALAVAPGVSLTPDMHGRPVFQARTINHVTLHAANVTRSREFYRTLTGLSVRDEGKDYCEFRVRGGFLGIYASKPGQQLGFDHFCFGIEHYEPKAALGALQAALPDSHPTLEEDDQVYLRDPDGVRVQIADVNYKR